MDDFSVHISRRRFLQKTGMALVAGVVFPTLIPSRALGRDGTVAPSNRITLGVVGMGQGASNLNRCMAFPDVQAVAVCEVDQGRLARGQRMINDHYGSKGAQGYRDFREMFAQAKLDAVILAAPDHWHGVMGVAAARAGIDIFGEKPIAHTLAEGRVLCNAVQRHGRVWQTGSWQRSVPNFRQAVELVRNGRLGKITHLEVGTLSTQNGFADSLKKKPARADGPPRTLDYDLWVGPAAWFDYDPRVTHYHWRWVSNFGGGNLMDWVGHHVDIAHWAMGLDHTGPVKIIGTGTCAATPPWNAETQYRYVCTYENGLTMTVSSDFPSGVKFYGERGWIYVDRGKLQASDPDILLETPGPDEIQVYRSDDHWRNFIDCVKTRRQTITPCEVGHRSASVGHLGHIAIRTGRTIHWDPATETIQNDPGASALLQPAYRSPWVL